MIKKKTWSRISCFKLWLPTYSDTYWHHLVPLVPHLTDVPPPLQLLWLRSTPRSSSTGFGRVRCHAVVWRSLVEAHQLSKKTRLENYESSAKGWIDDEILHLCVYHKVLIISSSLHPNIFGELIKASFQKDSSGITSNNNQGQLVTSAFPTFGNITPREWYKYPLVNIQITMENHHVEWENPLCLWSFSIAILT